MVAGCCFRGVVRVGLEGVIEVGYVEGLWRGLVSVWQVWVMRLEG